MGLIRLAPRALRDLYSSDSLRVATLEDDFPRDLLAENRRGLLAGPVALPARPVSYLAYGSLSNDPPYPATLCRAGRLSAGPGGTGPGDLGGERPVYQPGHANESDAAHRAGWDESVPAEPAPGLPAAGSQPVEGPLTPRPTGTGRRTTQENPADRAHRHDLHGGARHPRGGADGQWENRLTGNYTLLSPAAAAAVTQPIPVISRPPVREPLHLRLLKDPALRERLP